MFGLLKPELKELVCRYFWDNVPRLGSIGLSINNQNQKEGNLERFLVNFQDIINVKIDREHCPFIVGGDKGEGVTEYLERNGIVVNNKDYQHRMLYKYCSDVNKDLAQLFLNYSNGNYDNTQFEKKYGTPHEIVLDKNNETEIKHSRFEQQKPYMLSEAIKAYINESKASGITDKSINEYSSALELFIRVQGDSDVTAITREQLVKTKTILAKLPPNLNKKNAYKNKSIEQIIRLKHTPVSQTTLNNYMIRISQLFTWMEKYGKIQTNIAKDLTTKIKISNRDFREVFSDDMITAFFTSSEYLTTDKPENHWIPLIALFSGMRQNEICQLYVDDIKNKEGLYYFDINSKQDKQLKNKSAERMIPIHQTLIDLGFITYVESCKTKKYTRLWKNLLKGRDGYGTAFSQRVNRLIDNVVTTNSKVNFHSFRHTFANQMKQTSGIDLNIIEELLGHSRGSETADRYGKAYEPKVSLPEVNKLRYSFDFSLLKGKLLLKL